MHVLDFSGTPYWLDLGGGVSVLVLPFGTEVEYRARDLPPELRADLDGDQAKKSLGVIKAFGRGAILDWSGVETSGRATPGPWPEGIDALLSTAPFGSAFEQKYVTPALRAVAEKNAFAPSPTGTSAGAEATARPAPNDAAPASTGSRPH
ncbi:hypothetical protein [Ancylobacter mangrovi]|uniref:hypothetical protein n=1 Tax=Ancylobacter mangrovi TaxID=2972472 RepID=UPI00216213CD|nr:hypothetical protein [Ancylobacter mangrovi]MCS0501379.1 hypothetical protein [Ancylobacter mangrovi]